MQQLERESVEERVVDATVIAVGVPGDDETCEVVSGEEEVRVWEETVEEEFGTEFEEQQQEQFEEEHAEHVVLLELGVHGHLQQTGQTGIPAVTGDRVHEEGVEEQGLAHLELEGTTAKSGG